MSKRFFWPSKGGDEMQVLTITDRDGALYRHCESMEYQVFVESGYVEESPDGRISALNRYHPHAFLAALTGDSRVPQEKRRLSGVMRIIFAPQARKMGPGLFPTLDHAEELRIDPEKLARIMTMDPRRCIDVATMAIPKEQRDARVSQALIGQIIKHVRGKPPLRYALAAIDTVFYGKLKARGLPFEDLGPSVLYWGSPSTATIGDAYPMLRDGRKLVAAFNVFLRLGKLWR